MLIIAAALVPLMGGIQLRRGRAWGGYGLAMFYGGQIIIVALALGRAPNAAGLGRLLLAAAVAITMAPLFFLAGKSLAAQTSQRGSPTPWILVTALVTIPFFFFEPFVMPTGSMENTLDVGDKILVRRFPLGMFRRGDLVVFKYPVDRRQIFVKRVCGIPGDRVRIVNKMLYVNEMPLAEPYAIHRTESIDSYRDNFPSQPNVQLFPGAREMLRQDVQNGELIVPREKYFVLGDNRDLSLDSRYWGLVDAADLIGRPVLIYDSKQQPIPNDEAHAQLFPKTRWERLFRTL